MKCFTKCLSAYLAVLAILFASVFTCVVPSFADMPPIEAAFETYYSPNYFAFDLSNPNADSASYIEYQGFLVSGVFFDSVAAIGDYPVCLPGTYIAHGNSFTEYAFTEEVSFSHYPLSGICCIPLNDGVPGSPVYFDFEEPFTMQDPFMCFVQSHNLQPTLEYYQNELNAPLYQSAWDLFVRFIYGEGAELTPEQNFTLTLLATIAVLAVVLIPFAVVYFVLRFIFGWR